MQQKPLVGISKCLLGENVRYDGGHQLDRYLRDTLGTHVEFVPVCPEVECGLGVPREAMRLTEIDGAVRLLTRNSEADMTDAMQSWMTGRLRELARQPLCGFVFKAKSPSSGLFRVKIYQRNGGIRPGGTGIFAGGFTDAFPYIPVEEDGRLHDPRLRENFIERIFMMQRWHDLAGEKKSLGNLIRFHARHKYLLMAHCPKTLKELGALVAAGAGYSPGVLYDRYLEAMTRALKKIATVRKNTNVLLHIMGYFKKVLSADEKAELREIIDHYHAEQVPLVVPLTLINHYLRKHSTPYLQDQLYLNPHPLELMLRNHV
jgi:uncharacterized protein YbgA (DUF1722 family)/uncharacterized protein YbbK (DUF523 family)